jgi:Ca2+-binding RTX toxin-like protein
MAIFTGTASDDSLAGTAGNDQMDGLAGDDFIEGRGGDDTINGGDGNDTLYGDRPTPAVTDGNDVIDGGNGRDYIRAGGGNDQLQGGNDDDYLDGGTGDDLIDGGAGIDRAAFHSSLVGVHVDLNIQGVAQDTGQGMDTLVNIENVSGTTFDDILIGNGGDNWIWGEGGNDNLSGGGGNDLVEVGPGNAVADGGAGVDTLSLLDQISASAAGVTVSLAAQGAAQNTGEGSMTLSGFENLSGGIANDVLTGDGGANLLAGDLGNDSLIGGAGDDVLYGDGRVTIEIQSIGTSGAITTYADVAATFSDPSDPAGILVDGNDILEGGLGDDQLYGGGGIDTASYAHASGAVQVGLGNSPGSGFAQGADGDDILHDIENVIGSAFDDLIVGNLADNVLDGGDGHDLIRGGAGNDTLLGGNGDDFLNGGVGDDVLSGGAGFDRVSFFTGATAGVTVDLNLQGSAQNTGQGMDTLTGIEHVSGTTFVDALTGDGGDNWLWGEGGNDVLKAGGGNDLVQVGPGNAVADGGLGVDAISFLDTITGAPAGVTVSLALQGAAQATGEGSMLLAGFENLSGGTVNDTLTGNAGDNVIAGDSGNDTLSGGDGDDTLYGDGRILVDNHGPGGSGPITTFGDVFAQFGEPDGNDTLNGGKGNDALYGGGGDDVLTGGAGSDHFVFGEASGHDKVTDFAKKDVIQFDASSGVHNFADLTFTASGKDTLITWGTGDSILLEGVKAKSLSASDFAFDAPAAAFAFHSMDVMDHHAAAAAAMHIA